MRSYTRRGRSQTKNLDPCTTKKYSFKAKISYFRIGKYGKVQETEAKRLIPKCLLQPNLKPPAGRSGWLDPKLKFCCVPSELS